MIRKCMALALMLALLLTLGAPALGEAAAVPEDGLYTIGVQSNHRMFKVVGCLLRVRDGEMTAVLTLSGQGYGYIYAGTAAEAEAAPVDSWSPYIVGADGMYSYEIAIPALDADVAVAGWSKKYEKWYDRTLNFLSGSLKSYDLVPADGTYAAAVEYDHGLSACDIVRNEDGAESVKSDGPGTGACKLSVKDGAMTAEFEDFDAIFLGAPEEAAQAGSDATRAIALPSLDRDIDVSVLRDGAWAAHRVYVSSGSLTPLSNAPADGSYAIECRSDSGLFKVTGCTLEVAGGVMTAGITVKKASYARIYLGGSSEAMRAAEADCAPAEENADGSCTYHLVIPSLDSELTVSTYSEQRKAWYERTLYFDSATLAAQ